MQFGDDKVKKFSISELENKINGKVITWENNRSVKYFIEQPDVPMESCLYFLFEGCEDEDELLKKLIEYDAAGVMVRKSHGFNIDKWKEAGIGVIEVEHLTENYISLAKMYRNKLNVPFVEVIGSSGKTTTKEMIGAVVNAAIPALVGYNNYNAPSGVAYNIFSIRDYHKAAVLEVGMKAEGIMRLSSSIIKPHIAVLTSIHRAHFVSMGSIENIIEAKAEVLEYLDKDGVLIINGEDENCRKFPVERFKGKILKYGFSDKFDLWATDIVYKDFKTYFKAKGLGIVLDCMINTVGRYNVLNALAAIMVGIKFGMSKKDIIKGLASFETLTGRLKVHTGIKDTIIINDNFNANPDSTKLLLEEIPNFAKGRPVMLVMGDMERPDSEIKQYAQEVHYNIGQHIAKLDFEKLIAVGKWAKEYIKGAKSKGVSESKLAYFETVKEAEKYFKASIIQGSIIIFKASQYVPVRHLIKSLGIEY